LSYRSREVVEAMRVRLMALRVVIPKITGTTNDSATTAMKRVVKLMVFGVPQHGTGCGGEDHISSRFR